MASSRVLWDEYETAILMDFFIQYKNGEITKKDAICGASKALRERAEKNGVEIDDIFRNENGITMQMSKIEDLYIGRKSHLSKAPPVFENIADKYVNDRPSFDKILKEAQGVNDGITSVQEHNTDKSVVLFNALESYAFTRPEKLLYFGEVYAVKNWTQLYVKTVCCLYEDYPEVIKMLNGTNIGQRGWIDIADSSLLKNMAAPKELMDGYYLETNLSDTDIVSKIKQLLDLCRVDYENVVITYFSTKVETQDETNENLAAMTLVDYLRENGVYYVDNRDKGGCLWIRNTKEIQKVVGYCKKKFGVTFHYRGGGSRSLNGEMGWWTNDSENEIIKPVTPLSNIITRTSASSDSNVFLRWMVDEQHMSTSSGRSYVSGINNCEQMARKLGLEHTQLYGVGYEDARRTADALMQTADFKEANDSQHNRLRASLLKYLQYLSGDMRLSLSQAAQVIVSQPKSVEDLSPYDKVLQENFSKGYRVESTLDLKRFIRYYNATYDTDLDVNDEEVRGKTKRNIISVGIRHGDYVFSAESVVSSEIKEHLVSYVKRSFSQGKRVIYYKALFEEFNEEFLGQHIYDEDMLRTFLVHECGSDYVFERSFMSQERNVHIDPKEEIIEAIGVPEEYAAGTIRVSLGDINSEDDARMVAESIVSILT